ncbi:hypothetical protein RhiirC2_853237 [Rhizophagus irregularis]|uniref:Micro-fibrillar-associated protein 1 C-terminal domain-containing protein n=1 Tax=Rhizophagus irregularis TaxID=588596 RepID=A0A2N1MWH1_9GLOM|nr:hypothetical protein RhiirC2_853237 [Rhizophagus irregularis]
MQVKNFGHVGQTKWTHLVDQDTSVKDALWNAKTEINKRTLSKLGGLHGGQILVFEYTITNKLRTPF